MVEQNRTAEFFRQNVADLAEALQNRVLIDQRTNRQVQLTRLEPYPKVGPRYRDIAGKNMAPGELWTPYFPVRRMNQALIVAREVESGVGSCVRVLRGSYYDLEREEFIPMAREGDVAGHFGLEKFEKASLRFLDESDALYIVRGEAREVNINPSEANGELKRLLQ